MRIIFTVFTWMVTIGSVFAERPFPYTYPSATGEFMALVVPIGRDAKRTSVPDISTGEPVVEYDCRVEIYDWPKRQLLWSREFTSHDGRNDQSVTWGLWTKDPRYFVFATLNANHQHPAEYHLYAFNLQKRCLYLLDHYVGHIVLPIFGISGPRTVITSVLDRTQTSLDQIPRRSIRIDLESLLADKPPI